MINFERRGKQSHFQTFSEKTLVDHYSPSAITKAFILKKYSTFTVQQEFTGIFQSLLWFWWLQVRVSSGICVHFRNGFTVAKSSYISSISVGKMENIAENI